MNLAMKQVWVADHVATGANVKALRITAGVSLRAVASLMGVSAPYLHDLERGRRNWSADKLKQVETAIRRTSNITPHAEATKGRR